MSSSATNHALQSEKTIESLWKITKVVLDTLEFDDVTQKICDSLLSELGYLNLGYRIIVLSLLNAEKTGLQRISLSQTPQAQAAVTVSPIPFKSIVIPIDAEENICTKAFKEQKPFETTDWKDILCPPLAPDEARNNQKAADIQSSLVYPVVVKGKSVGVLIFSLIKSTNEVSQAEKDLLSGFADIVGIAVQNAKLYSNLEQTTNNLNDANSRLIALDKIKDEFVYLASHELRTPLTAIKSYAWMVLNGKSEAIGPTTKKYLDVVYSSTERLIHLVNEMLDLSRIESGKVQLNLESVDLDDLILVVKSEFSARSTEKHLTLKSETIPLTIKADKDKIMQIFENLVGNSFKFTPPGGKITIHTVAKDKFAEISIVDNGKGIAEEDVPKLFAKFGRLDNNSMTTTPESGTGLGLYITKQFVELHGGQVTVNSKVGEGTTFTFTIPLA